MNLNGFSIVIATKGRVKLLEDLLISVKEARKNFDGPSEVLLIDDSNEIDVIEVEKCVTNMTHKEYIFHHPLLKREMLV